MNDRFSRRPSTRPLVEMLESRTLLSGVAAVVDSGITPDHSAVLVPAKAAKVKDAGTKTIMTISAGTLGQPVTFTVTVRAAAAAGAPTGTVNLVVHRTVEQTLTLTAATSTNAKYAISTATYNYTPEPGGPAFFIGKLPISAVYVPSGAFKKSSANGAINVAKPKYTNLANGVKIETIVPGSGAGVEAGQTANVLYTGYLAKNGKIFDDSDNHASNGMVSTFGFAVDASPEQVIPGFDEGAVGMEVGETRLVYIPWQEGYGKAGSPPSVPSKADLIFVLTLASIT